MPIEAQSQNRDLPQEKNQEEKRAEQAAYNLYDDLRWNDKPDFKKMSQSFEDMSSAERLLNKFSLVDAEGRDLTDKSGNKPEEKKEPEGKKEAEAEKLPEIELDTKELKLEQPKLEQPKVDQADLPKLELPEIPQPEPLTATPKGKFEYDAQGRVTSMENEDGSKKRSFSYEGDSKTPLTIDIEDRKSGTQTRWTAISDGSGYATFDQYNRRTDWHGEAKMREDGTYCIKSKGSEDWIAHYGDGRIQKEHVTSEGTKVALNEQGEPIEAHSQNGHTRKAEYDDKGLANVKVDFDSQNSSAKRSYERQENGTYKVTPAPEGLGRNAGEFSQVSLDKNGDVKAVRKADGARVTDRADGTMRIDKKDGTFAELDGAGRVTRSGTSDSKYRSFEYDGYDLVKATDVDGKKQPTVIYDAADKKDISSAQVINGDSLLLVRGGGKDAEVQAPNGALVKLDDQTRPVDVTMPNGNKREFDYDAEGQISGYRDTKIGVEKDGKTPRTSVESWTRTPEGDFAGTAADGKPITQRRQDLAVDINGDVRYKATDKNGEAPTDRVAHASDLVRPSEGQVVREARAHLEEIAAANGVNMERFRGHMDYFEERSRKWAETGLKGPSEAQIAKTYENLSKLMEGSGKDVFNKADRAKLAEEAMYNISTPWKINQGYNPTCNMTTGEVYIASRAPEKYAEILGQVASTGMYRTAGGKEVNPGIRAFQPTPEERNFDPDRQYQSNTRNWASHIVQHVGINAFTGYAQRGVMPSWGQWYYGNGQNPCMGGDAIKESVRDLTGHDMPYIPHGVAPTAEQLMQYKRDGNFPVGIPTLYSGGSEQHVQTIHNVRQENGRTEVYLDDQNGQGNDRGWVPLDQLYARQGLGAPVQNYGPRFVNARR